MSVEVGSNKTMLEIFFTCSKVITDSVLCQKYWMNATEEKKNDNYHPLVVVYQKFFVPFVFEKAIRSFQRCVCALKRKCRKKSIRRCSSGRQMD